MSLAKLIAHNLYVNAWIFKIDNEFGGRGHAILQVDTIEKIKNLRKKKIEITDPIIESIVQMLRRTISKKVKIAMPSLYRDWNEYITNFCAIGGVIEASPTCNS